MPQYKEYLL